MYRQYSSRMGENLVAGDPSHSDGLNVSGGSRGARQSNRCSRAVKPWRGVRPSGVPMGSGLLMLKVKMDCPNLSCQMVLRLEFRPADFGTSNCGACSEAVVGLGWSSQVFMVFEDNSGDCSKIASLLPNERVRPCVRSCAPKSGHFRC